MAGAAGRPDPRRRADAALRARHPLSLAWAGEAGTGSPARPLGTALGYLLFAVVVLGVLLGLTFIVATGFGKALSFAHVYPTIVTKH